MKRFFDIQPDSSGNSFRRKRIRLLNELISDCLKRQNKCEILDIGGTFDFWHVWEREIDWTRTGVTCINLNPAHASKLRTQSKARMIKGNACSLPNISDQSYDIAFSNSVIEHVGFWRDMVAMAGEVRRVAPRYLVQTPNVWFPIEPHARTPFLHWLPEPVAYRIVMMRKCGYWGKQDTVSAAVEQIQSARLIDFRQMQELFPDARIIRERFVGVTKSLIAFKSLDGQDIVSGKKA